MIACLEQWPAGGGGAPPAAPAAMAAFAVRLGVWEVEAQRPALIFARALAPRRAFWDARDVPGARALEAAFPAIKAEFDARVAWEAAARRGADAGADAAGGAFMV